MCQNKFYRIETKKAVFGVECDENNKIVRYAPYSRCYVGENVDRVLYRFRTSKITWQYVPKG